MNNSSRRQARVPILAAALGFVWAAAVAAPAHAEPAESVRSRQWHLDAMHADDMWKTSTGRGVTVAVIDTGVGRSLADLRGQVLDGKDFSYEPGDEHTDYDGHGTGMAALIAATGARGRLNGSYGLAPGAKILPIRLPDYTAVFDFDKKKEDAVAAYAKAIRYAAHTDAKIINISHGTYNSPGKKDADTPELASAVRHALKKGKLIFAAAGNSGDTHNQPGYPASTPGVVAVGAITKNIQRSTISEHGSQIDITAPGEDVIHACPGGTQLCRGTGTSAASALASASAALIWSKHPDWTNNQVLRVLINTMRGNEKGWTHNNDFGYGIVRPRVALTSPGDPGPADEYPLPDLTSPASASPMPRTTASAGREATGGRPDDQPAATAPTADKDSSAGLWAGLGIAAAAILVPVLAAVRKRRTRPTAPPPRPAQPPAPPGGPSRPPRHTAPPPPQRPS